MCMSKSSFCVFCVLCAFCIFVYFVYCIFILLYISILLIQIVIDFFFISLMLWILMLCQFCQVKTTQMFTYFYYPSFFSRHICISICNTCLEIWLEIVFQFLKCVFGQLAFDDVCCNNMTGTWYKKYLKNQSCSKARLLKLVSGSGERPGSTIFTK